jgi:hypothetical protein
MNAMLDKLDNRQVDNPKQYWKLINDIRDVQRDDSTLVQINFEGALRKSVHVPLELLKLNLARISHDILRWQSE